MLLPEEIQKANLAQTKAILDRFEKSVDETPTSTDGAAPKEMYWTRGDLTKYKNDLEKAIDDGSMTVEELETKTEELGSLIKKSKTVEGQEFEVFVKA